MSARREQIGFTLIETIAVLAVVGILAVYAINRFSASNASAVAEADALKAALRYAQARAMADVYTWGIQFSGNTYSLVEDNPHINGALLPGTSSNNHTMPGGVSLSGGGTILFDWRGQPVSGNITTPGGSSNVVTTNQNITVTQTSAVTITVTPYTGFVP